MESMHRSPSLTPDQIALLGDTLEKAATLHPTPNAPTFAFATDTDLRSPKDLAESFRKDEEFRAKFCHLVALGTEVVPFERILSRFLPSQEETK